MFLFWSTRNPVMIFKRSTFYKSIIDLVGVIKGYCFDFCFFNNRGKSRKNKTIYGNILFHLH